MKNKIKTLVIIISILTIFPAYGNKLFWIKADAWNNLLDYPQKTMFIAGVLDGLIFAEESVQEEFSFTISHKVYIKGLDKFYSDYRNEFIPAVFAMKIVSMELKGLSDEKIQERIRSLRDQFHETEKERQNKKIN